MSAPETSTSTGPGGWSSSSATSNPIVLPATPTTNCGDEHRPQRVGESASSQRRQNRQGVDQQGAGQPNGRTDRHRDEHERQRGQRADTDTRAGRDLSIEQQQCDRPMPPGDDGEHHDSEHGQHHQVGWDGPRRSSPTATRTPRWRSRQRSTGRAAPTRSTTSSRNPSDPPTHQGARRAVRPPRLSPRSTPGRASSVRHRSTARLRSRARRRA